MQDKKAVGYSWVLLTSLLTTGIIASGLGCPCVLLPRKNGDRHV